MFMLMLRCGLRVQEVAELTVDAIEFGRRQIFVFHGKGAKDRVVYMSEDARSALLAYLAKRSSKARGLFLVQKGPMRGTPLSVRGIQKRIEYYARKSELNVSCHRLRHTMATQLLNADADLATIQDLLGHGQRGKFLPEQGLLSAYSRRDEAKYLDSTKYFFIAAPRAMKPGPEYALEIEVGQLVTVVRHAYTHFRITLHAFDCRWKQGRPRKIEVDDWRWVTLDELGDFAFAVTSKDFDQSLVE
jgi:hypothetical protein